MSTKIQWTNETWNPVVGCSKCSPGCDHCYAERMAYRLACIEAKKYDDDLTSVHYAGALRKKKWNGKTAFVESALTKPLHWKTGRMVFVCSMGDLFHPSVPFEWIDKVFAVMALCPQHTFQVLTKRSKRILEYFSPSSELKGMTRDCLVEGNAHRIWEEKTGEDISMEVPVIFPLRNVWLGVTAEDQQRADERIPDLLKCPAAKRFVSCEPLLGEIDLRPYIHRGLFADPSEIGKFYDPLDQVICGGESGPGARPMHPDWARCLRDQCSQAGVPFFFKQMGGHPKKRAKLEEIPEDLRIRQYPESEASK